MAGRGRKRQISPEDMARAEGYALDGCKNNTIATLMGWGHSFIDDRPDIRKRLTLKRAERTAELRATQRKQSKSNPVMAIWLGKNELNQTDKSEITGGNAAPLLPPQIVLMPKPE